MENTSDRAQERQQFLIEYVRLFQWGQMCRSRDHDRGPVAEPSCEMMGSLDESRLIVSPDHHESRAIDLIHVPIQVPVEPGLILFTFLFCFQCPSIHVTEELTDIGNDVTLGAAVTDTPSHELDFQHLLEIATVGGSARFHLRTGSRPIRRLAPIRWESR